MNSIEKRITRKNRNKCKNASTKIRSINYGQFLRGQVQNKIVKNTSRKVFAEELYFYRISTNKKELINRIIVSLTSNEHPDLKNDKEN